MDERVIKHAKVLVNYSLALKSGERFFLEGSIATLPLIRTVYLEALKVGAFVQVMISDPAIEEMRLKYGNDEQLTYFPESVMTIAKTADAFLSIWGSTNTRNLSNVPPENLKKSAEGRSELTKIFFERMGKGEMRWCGTLFPTEAEAQEASMSLSEYEEFVYTACHLDSNDPVAEWKKIHDQQQKYVDFLNDRKHLRIISRDTNIEMSIEGRKWINSDGHANFPSGEVFTGPVEDTVNGHIRFSFPGIFQGREIEDIRLTFESGKVVKAEASKGQELLEKLLEIKGASYVGEVAMGTNYNITKFTKNMLFDEKIGGTVHLALGRSFPETGGKNESDIHWDMLCDMREGGEIYADDELIYKDGRFLI